MAITPKEAETLQSDEFERIANAEASIDARLKATYQPGQECRIQLGDKLTSRELLELLRRYRLAGWEASTDVEKYMIDQRDSPPSGRRVYLVLKKARDTSSYSSLAHQIASVEANNNGPYS